MAKREIKNKGSSVRYESVFDSAAPPKRFDQIARNPWPTPPRERLGRIARFRLRTSSYRALPRQNSFAL
jgi:hypothetical protein